MSGWYTYAVVSLVLMGTQRFLYKVSAERNCNTAWTTFSFMATVAILSSILFLVLRESVSNIRYLLLVAFINGGAFFIATISHIEALKRVPANITYPIIRLNVAVVVIFSLLYFKDRLTLYQVAGIVLAITVVLILGREMSDAQTSHRNLKRGFFLIFTSLLSGTAAVISSKFAAIHTNRLAFIALSYTMATLFSLGVKRNFQAEAPGKNNTDALIIGILMGLINLGGFYAFLKALSLGPLSVIASITGMHFVIAIVLSALIYKEKLTSSRILGVLFTIFTVILLRL
jgi:drug/metabolite transporter (DMT)-like permease